MKEDYCSNAFDSEVTKAQERYSIYGLPENKYATKKQIQYIEDIIIPDYESIDDISYRYHVRFKCGVMFRAINTFRNCVKYAPIKSQSHNDNVFSIILKVEKDIHEIHKTYIIQEFLGNMFYVKRELL